VIASNAFLFLDQGNEKKVPLKILIENYKADVTILPIDQNLNLLAAPKSSLQGKKAGNYVGGV